MLKTLHKAFLILCLIFVETVVLVVIGGVLYVGWGILYLFMSGGGFPSPAVTIPSAFAWIDQNANGHFDSDEIPISGVCVRSTSSTEKLLRNFSCDVIDKTGLDGKWFGAEYPGRLREDIYIIANAPQGYKFTSSPVVKGTDAEFGFVSVESPLGQMFSTDDVINHYFEQERQHRVRNKIVYSIIGSAVFSLLFYIANLISKKILSLK